MTAAEGSFLGIAKQTAAGTPNTTDNAFKYLLFNQGAVAPNNVVLPLDPEVGGGAMIRDMKKMGVLSGGSLDFVPRPSTLGLLLLGALGAVSTAPNGETGVYNHTFDMGTDQFAAPYFTLRSAPGNLWGEQMQDCRVSALALEWRGANFVRGSVGFQGGLPAKVATTAWAAAAKVDGGPPFITPVSDIELPTGTDIKVLSGSFIAGLGIPLDEQWIVGAYSPDAMDITQRSFALQFAVKITDATLYSKMMYDPAAGNAWVASLFREGRVKVEFKTDVYAGGTVPYSLTISANGQQDASSNVVWSASPIGLRAGRQLVMNVTGMFLADPAGTNEPITAVLVNKEASY